MIKSEMFERLTIIMNQILVVEDNEDYQELLVNFLSNSASSLGSHSPQAVPEANKPKGDRIIKAITAA